MAPEACVFIPTSEGGEAEISEHCVCACMKLSESHQKQRNFLIPLTAPSGAAKNGKLQPVLSYACIPLDFCQKYLQLAASRAGSKLRRCSSQAAPCLKSREGYAGSVSSSVEEQGPGGGGCGGGPS